MSKELPKRMQCPGCKRMFDIAPQDTDREGNVQCFHHDWRESRTLVVQTGHPFQVGDGVHWSFNGDSYPGTVRKISPSGKTVWVSQDDHLATQAAKDYIKEHGLHEGCIDSVFVPQDTDLKNCRIFKLKKTGRFIDMNGTWTLHHTREYAQNPHF